MLITLPRKRALKASLSEKVLLQLQKNLRPLGELADLNLPIIMLGERRVQTGNEMFE